MKPTLEVLKLRAEVAALEVQLAEQRIEFTELIWKARQLILATHPVIHEREHSDYMHDRAEWLAKTDKFVV